MIISPGRLSSDSLKIIYKIEFAAGGGFSKRPNIVKYLEAARNKMARIITATFDGEEFIPDEPVDLKPGTRVTLTIIEVIGKKEELSIK